MAKNISMIDIQPDGFELTGLNGPVTRVMWEQVREIVAYRRDPGGDDLLCLGFRISGGGDYVEVHEEMDNYLDLLEVMYERYPEIHRDWWQNITEGLGPNRETIYGLPLADSNKLSAAERYLQKNRQPYHITRPMLKRWAKIAGGVLVAILIQHALAWLITRWPTTWVDDAVALLLLPSLLTVIICRFWGGPKGFFILLGGFLLGEWLFNGLIDGSTPSLLGKIFAGHLGYLLILGLLILLGMGTMAMPDKRAAGVMPKSLTRR